MLYQLKKLKNSKDKKLNEFNSALFKVLLNLSKRIAADGEGASKFVTIKVKNCNTEKSAKEIGVSIANSSLVKTAIAGEDPNWGRIIMAIGKAGVDINLKKLSIKFGDLKIVSNGKLFEKYEEEKVKEYMKNPSIEIEVDISTGTKDFTVFTMDLTKEYIKINSDYRS